MCEPENGLLNSLQLNRVNGKSDLVVPTCIFFLAFIVRLLLAWRLGYFHNFERDEMVRIALSIVKFHEYGNPYLIPTGPTAHEMPLYPLLLSAIYAMFGVGATAEAVKITLACAVTALRCALLPRFCLDVSLGRMIGIIAGLLGAVYVSALQTEVRGNWDSPFQALVLLILISMTVKTWRERSWLARTPWRYYLMWGVAILLQPAFVTILLTFLLAGLVVTAPTARWRYLRQCVLLLLTSASFLAPWAIRNDLRLGKLIWTRDNFGLEFWVSNGPRRAFDMQTNLGFAVPHPSLNLQEAERVLQLGEVRYNQMKLHEAMDWLRNNPAAFVTLTSKRMLAWWFPPGHNLAHRILSLGFSLLAFIGLGLTFRTQRLIAILFCLSWLSFPCVYYLIQWSSKYRYSIEWQLSLCAAVTIAAIVTAICDRYPTEASR